MSLERIMMLVPRTLYEQLSQRAQEAGVPKAVCHRALIVLGLRYMSEQIDSGLVDARLIIARASQVGPLDG